jgi:riboflavin kinase/FMN adenylyltransferase
MPDALRGAVIALGNFDGFHLGHQAVAGEAIRQARAAGKPAIIATFDPHPVRFFAPHIPWFRLTTLEQRQRHFAGAGADAMLVFDFDAELAATTAEDFVVKLLAGRLGISGVVTGEDFTFGKARGGNTTVLRDLGAAHGIAATTVGPVMDEGGVISSSRIRDALKAGDCETATRLLTRPFAVEAVVQHGPLSPPAIRRLCGARETARRTGARWRRQSRRPPAVRTAQGIARAAFLRFCRDDL